MPNVDVDSNGVLILTASNFYSTIAAFDQLLVEFYSPYWYFIILFISDSGHCKNFAPAYGKAA